MLTNIDKALQDFIISAIGMIAIFGIDLSSFQNILLTVGVPLAKAVITWLVPNKPKKPA